MSYRLGGREWDRVSKSAYLQVVFLSQSLETTNSEVEENASEVLHHQATSNIEARRPDSRTTYVPNEISAGRLGLSPTLGA